MKFEADHNLSTNAAGEVYQAQIMEFEAERNLSADAAIQTREAGAVDQE